MDKVIFWCLVGICVMTTLVMWLYIRQLKRIIEFQRNWLMSIISNGNLISESLSIIAVAYGYTTVEKLIEAIERGKAK